MKRTYNIVPNYYSPMCEDWGMDLSYESSHGIIYRNCNYNCVFCNNKFHPRELYHEYDEEQFICAILRLMNSNNRFKFSGGEQTLNPYLSQDLDIVKKLGGYVFLDSNGSKPDVIRELVEKELIDVLGISLKGLTKEQALSVSGIKKDELCWQNVFNSIRLATKHPSLRVIVTYVFYNDATLETLRAFAALIKPYPNIYLKVNNLLHQKHHQDGLVAVDPQLFNKNIHDFVKDNPEWAKRVIVVNDEDAITQYSKITFL